MGDHEINQDLALNYSSTLPRAEIWFVTNGCCFLVYIQNAAHTIPFDMPAINVIVVGKTQQLEGGPSREHKIVLHTGQPADI